MGRMTENTPRFTKKIERGAAFLDKDRPGWETRIDLGMLNIRSGSTCVLAQCYIGYDNGLRALGFFARFFGAVGRYGFDIGAFEKSRYYAVLTDEWRQFIANRLEKLAQAA